MKITLSQILVFIISLLSGSVFGQAVIWTEASGPKAGAIIIPADLAINFPTSDEYEIGFFYEISDNSNLTNLGKADYHPGSATMIYLGNDESGANGYQTNDKLVSLVRNKTTNKTYGIQFTFQDDVKTFTPWQNVKVTGVLYTTWERHIDPGFEICITKRRIPINIPYGLHPQVLTTSGVVLSKNGAYSVIELDKMVPEEGYSVQILDTFPDITYNYSLLSFWLIGFPLETLNATDSICQGEVITIPTFTEKDSLTREAIGNTPYQIITPGEYLYKTTNLKNGCFSTDSITVVAKQQCSSYEEPGLINPLYGGQIVFPNTENIKIFNSNMEKITEFEAPAIWRGTNASGTILPIGIYFIQHGDEKQESITLIY